MLCVHIFQKHYFYEKEQSKYVYIIFIIKIELISQHTYAVPDASTCAEAYTHIHDCDQMNRKCRLLIN